MQHLVGEDFTPAGVFDLAVKRSEGVVAGRPGDFSGRAVASVRLGAQDMSLLVGILMAQTQRADGRNGPVAAHTQQRRRVHRGRHRVRIDQSHVGDVQSAACGDMTGISIIYLLPFVWPLPLRNSSPLCGPYPNLTPNFSYNLRALRCGS